MNDEQKAQYIRRMQEGMRPMTPEQIAEKQAGDYARMANAPLSNGDAARNFWPEIVRKP